jgi:peptidyl-prolyl cis-trans isomerase C
MKSRLLPLLIAATAAVVTISGCNKEPKVDDSPVIATVNGSPVTEQAYEFFKARLHQRIHPDPAKERELILEQMINQRLLVGYAESKKLDQEADVYQALQRQRDALLVGAAQRDILKGYPDLTEEDVKARYDEEVKSTHKTAYRVSHIVVPTADEAKAIIAELKKGGDFAKLAKEKSKGPTGDKGGELGWVQQGMVVPEFFAAAIKLKKGDYTTEPVKTQFGWHVIKVSDTRKVDIPPYDKIKGDVARLIQQDRIKKKMDELRSEAKIDIKEANVTEEKTADSKPAEDEKKEDDKK